MKLTGRVRNNERPDEEFGKRRFGGAARIGTGPVFLEIGVAVAVRIAGAVIEQFKRGLADQTVALADIRPFGAGSLADLAADCGGGCVPVLALALLLRALAELSTPESLAATEDDQPALREMALAL